MRAVRRLLENREKVVCSVAQRFYHASGHWPPRCCGAMAAQISPRQIGLAPSSLHQTRLDLGVSLVWITVFSSAASNRSWSKIHLTLCRSCTIDMGTDKAAQHAATHDSLRSHDVGGGFEGASSVLVAFGK
ncbi:uncharacterized protein K441DRAFT_310442 [Cenococcum geophilum 1.58]|uniref:uncharacterized protein n=1 Tax=Cenococcum geophilum 1.58 TaxID=794803 RepID=UPI00358E8CD7|nr:hypothetical protein K441DRAFT_310442 [Cenococcum geophilum 1.58]